MVQPSSTRVLTEAAASALYSPTFRIPTRGRLAGPKWLFVGDSITVGSGASNASFGFRVVTPSIAGGFVCAPASINGGLAGDTAANLLTRLPALLTQGAQAVFLLIGTNDASSAVSLSTYQANIRAIKALVDAAGLPLMMGLVPPRGSGTSATILTAINAMNLWLRAWTASQGVPLVDTVQVLADPTTGTMASAYNSGDGIHPNDTGHSAIAIAVAAMMTALIQQPAWPVVSAGIGGLTTQPLNASNTWSAAGGTTADTSVLDSPVDGDGLPAGKWLRTQHTNSSGATTYSIVSKTIDPTGWSPGDRIGVFMRIVGDKVGSINKVQLLNQAGSPIAVPIDGVAVAKPGPIAFTYLIPTSSPPTGLALSFVLACPAGTTSFVRVGATDVFNLTRLGVDLGI